MPAPARFRRAAAPALLAIVAGVLSACAPAPPPPSASLARLVCLDRPPSSAADYQRAFATRGVWAGGDIGADVALPDGRVAWLFGDTFVDGLNPDGSPRYPFVNNSLIVQSGSCFSMLESGTVGARRAALPASAPGTWLWPSGAVVDPAGVLRVVGLRMAPADGPAGWQWAVQGVDVASLTLPGLVWTGTVAAPIPQDARVSLSGGVLASGGQVYVYGTVDGRPVAARTSPGTMTTQPWAFARGTGWTTDAFAATALAVERAPAAQLMVIPHAGGFLASAKSADVMSDDVTTWFGASPTGPFRRLGEAAATPAPAGYFTYAGRVSALPGAGLVAVWSQNGDPSQGFPDARRYGPQFAAPDPTALP